MENVEEVKIIEKPEAIIFTLPNGSRAWAWGTRDCRNADMVLSSNTMCKVVKTIWYPSEDALNVLDICIGKPISIDAVYKKVWEDEF